MDQDHGSGVVGGAGAPIPAAAVAALIAGPLFKQFADAYPGPIGGAERLFVAMVKRGENVDPIIAAARGADKSVPADRWLDARGWEAAPKPAPDKPAAAKQTAECTISPEAFALADKLAGIAGQDPEFLEPGWCGAAWRCQQWLNEGYPPDLIEAGIKSMVAAKRGQKIGSISYFEKGLARFIAEHTKPVPNVVELKAETVEVKRESNWRDREDRKSGLAAIDRVYDRIEAEMQRRDGTREAEDKRR
jgi:hypothetical protein